MNVQSQPGVERYLNRKYTSAARCPLHRPGGKCRQWGARVEGALPTAGCSQHRLAKDVPVLEALRSHGSQSFGSALLECLRARSVSGSGSLHVVVPLLLQSVSNVHQRVRPWYLQTSTPNVQTNVARPQGARGTCGHCCLRGTTASSKRSKRYLDNVHAWQ